MTTVALTPTALSLAQVLNVFELLIETYPHYIHRARDAVEDIGMRLVRKHEPIRDALEIGVLDNVLGWLENEIARISKPTPSSYASADLFVLLNRSCGLHTTSIFSSPKLCFLPMAVLTGVLATPLDLQLNPSTRSNPPCRKSHPSAHPEHFSPRLNLFTCSCPRWSGKVEPNTHPSAEH
ncbi:hypothetical protein OG21DRAFT_1485207 [Imleria badia]|nr:hypothetical protein OG21DRAFT_1485207 [Imleria badia]